MKMEDYKGIIDFIFQKKNEEGLINYNSAEANKLDRQSQIKFKNIMRFINNEVDYKKRGKLIHLFKLYNQSINEYYQEENALCYKGGFSDGIQTIYEILPSEIKNAE